MKFRLSQTQIEVDYLAVCAWAMVLIVDTSGAVVLCMIAAFIHECGHLLCMCLVHQSISRVSVSLFDIAIVCDSDKSFTEDLVITSGGVVSNFIFGAVFLFVYKPLAISNFVIGMFNLLPVVTFDGGHALRLVLSRRLSLGTVDTILHVLSFLILVPMLCIGLLFLIKSRYNYSLLAIALYLFAVLYLK